MVGGLNLKPVLSHVILGLILLLTFKGKRRIDGNRSMLKADSCLVDENTYLDLNCLLPFPILFLNEISDCF
jgi:hypothetical protein